jgi:hypothetical protein
VDETQKVAKKARTESQPLAPEKLQHNNSMVQPKSTNEVLKTKTAALTFNKVYQISLLNRSLQVTDSK